MSVLHFFGVEHLPNGANWQPYSNFSAQAADSGVATVVTLNNRKWIQNVGSSGVLNDLRFDLAGFGIDQTKKFIIGSRMIVSSTDLVIVSPLLCNSATSTSWVYPTTVAPLASKFPAIAANTEFYIESVYDVPNAKLIIYVNGILSYTVALPTAALNIFAAGNGFLTFRRNSGTANYWNNDIYLMGCDSTETSDDISPLGGINLVPINVTNVVTTGVTNTTSTSTSDILNQDLSDIASITSPIVTASPDRTANASISCNIQSFKTDGRKIVGLQLFASTQTVNTTNNNVKLKTTFDGTVVSNTLLPTTNQYGKEILTIDGAITPLKASELVKKQLEIEIGVI